MKQSEQLWVAYIAFAVWNPFCSPPKAMQLLLEKLDLCAVKSFCIYSIVKTFS